MPGKKPEGALGLPAGGQSAGPGAVVYYSGMKDLSGAPAGRGRSVTRQATLSVGYGVTARAYCCLKYSHSEQFLTSNS